MAEVVPVGTVRALYRYPVKSMRGESIDHAHVQWHGLEGDRRYAFVRSDDPSGFPWLTARQVPALVRYTPSFADPRNPTASVVRVRTPDGRDMQVDDPDLLGEIQGLYRSPIYLMQLSRGAYDAAALSLIGQPTLDALASLIGRELDARRFRPNVLVDPADRRSGVEDTWRGALLVFGERADSARVRANRKDVRCMMINLDPDTSEHDPRVLRAVVQTRDECTGIYGSVEAPGTIHVGDPIYLVRDAPVVEE